MSATTGSVLTIRNRVGLVLAGLLALADVLGPSPAGVAAQLHFPQATGDPGDPFSINPAVAVGAFVANAILCLATLVGATATWVSGNRVAARVVAAARVIAGLLVVPMFLIPDLPAWLIVIAAALVIVNITAVILVLSRPAAPALPG